MIKLNYRRTLLILGLAMFVITGVLSALFFRMEIEKNSELVARAVTSQMEEIAFVLSDALESNDMSSYISYLDRQVISNDSLDSLTLTRDGRFIFSTERGAAPSAMMKDVGVQDIQGKRIYSRSFSAETDGRVHSYVLVARLNKELYNTYRSDLVYGVFVYCLVATLLMMLIEFIVIYFFYIASFKKFFNSILSKNFSNSYYVQEIDTLNRIFSSQYDSLKSANQSLRHNMDEMERQKNLFQTLFDNLPVPVYFKDIKGRYQSVNKKFLQMHNYEREEEVIGLNVGNFLEPEKAAAFKQSDIEVMEHPERQVVFEDEIFVPIIGRKVNIIFYKAAISNEKGEVSGLVTAMLDVTEERNLERLKNRYAEQLEKEKQRLSEMFKSHSAIMFIVDPDTGMIKDANDAASKFYGYSNEELISMSMGRINRMSDEDLINVLRLAKNGTKSYFEYRHRVKDGSCRDVEIHSSPFKAGDSIQLFVVIHDITLKKRHELIGRMHLEVASAFLQETDKDIFSAANMALLRGFKAEFGYLGYIEQDGSLVCPSLTDDIGSSCTMSYNNQFVFPQEMWGGIWGTSLQEKRIIYNNGALSTPEGHAALKNAMAVPIVYRDVLLGQFTMANVDSGFDGSHVEMAENLNRLIAPVMMHWRRNKYHEENLQKEKHELELAVDKEMELKKRGEQVLFEQKKFADMGLMMNAIAHQWRQPLNALGLLIQELPDGYIAGEIDNAYLDDYVSSGLRLINHMSDTIDHFRDFFMPDKEKVAFEAVNEIVSLFRLINIQLRSKDIDARIVCRCDKKTMECAGVEDFPGCEFAETRIYGYIGEFKQSILNIVYNSVDAVHDRAASDAKFRGRILLSMLASKGVLRITIDDNGGGVPPTILDQIFDPYFTTKPQGKGTGIGLYMTRLIIEQHMDGRITAENTEEGARFIITLPVYKK